MDMHDVNIEDKSFPAFYLDRLLYRDHSKLSIEYKKKLSAIIQYPNPRRID